MAEEYIKREDAIQSVVNHDILKSNWSRDWAEYMLEDAKPADVVPVVRCKDCFLYGECQAAKFYGDDGYCSVGERRDDEGVDS